MTQVNRTEGLVGNTAIKAAVQLATTTSLGANLTGLPVIDGVQTAAGDRILRRSETDQTLNGIWVADTGLWDRAEDFDGYYDIAEGTIVTVLHGSTLAATLWRISTVNPTIGGNIAFVQSSLSPADANSVSFLQAGTGAVSRTMQDKERDIVSAFDYMTAAQVAATKAYTYTTDVKAALDLAFAQTTAVVYIPRGGYYCATDLARPTCVGIVGDGWQKGAADSVSGTGIQFAAGVTTGLLINGPDGPNILRDFALYGNATAAAIGIDVGHNTDGTGSKTVNHLEVQRVRIANFTGAGAIGLFLGDSNYVNLLDVVLDGNNVQMKGDSRDTTTTIGPADTQIINLTTLSQPTAGAYNIQLCAGSFEFTNLKVGLCQANALMINVAQSASPTRVSLECHINGLSIENSNASVAGVPRAGPSIYVSGANAADGYVFLSITNLNHDGGDYCMMATGDGVHVLLDNPQLFGTNPLPTTTITVDAGATLRVENWPEVQTGSVTPIALNSVAAITASGVIDSPAYAGTYTAARTGMAGADVSITYVKSGRIVNLKIPAFSGAESATGISLGACPALLRPAVQVRGMPILCSDNGGTQVFGTATMGTNGILTLYPTAAQGNWANAGNAVFEIASLTYNLG